MQLPLPLHNVGRPFSPEPARVQETPAHGDARYCLKLGSQGLSHLCRPWNPYHTGHRLTMSGSQSDSHIPYICSEQVPLTTKSSVTMGQPMRSREQMKG